MDAREALEAALKAVVMTIAFLGRDAGTDRLAGTIEGLMPTLTSADKTLRAALSAPRVEPVASDKLGFIEAMSFAERGLERWKAKDHNAKWWKRIDGTPIPNDLLVNIAQEFAEAEFYAHPAPPDTVREAEVVRWRQRAAQAEAVLEFIVAGYDNQYINHVDFRVEVYKAALDALHPDAGDRK